MSPFPTPSRDVDETSRQSFPGSDPPSTWANAGRAEEPSSERPTGADDLTPRQRRRIVRHASWLWIGAIAVAVAMVAAAVIGLAATHDRDSSPTVAFTIIGIGGAALALVATLWRGKAGDDTGESRL